MRISDIFKKANQDRLKPEPASEAPKEFSIPLNKPQEVQPQAQKAPDEQDNSFLPAENAYGRAIIEIKKLLTRLQKNETPVFDPEVVADLVKLIQQDNQELLTLADRSTPDNYLFAHSVNVSIFSILIGTSLGFNQARLLSLGICAFLHDLGMWERLELAQKNAKLTEGEFCVIKKHPSVSREIATGLRGIPDNNRSDVVGAIIQVHERKDGLGYPDGLKDNDIDELAKIISIADVFEAATHPRSYHPRVIPHEGLKMLVCESEHKFDTVYLKAFIEKISLYPPGSYVLLNTGEIARVVRAKKGVPTRPSIKIILNSSLEKVKQPRSIDLSDHPTVSVKEAVDETKLNLTDKKAALELKATRWWVKGI
jgi:HD-GYP domain-containing protein (c-di-GMP phosphodiesterase class II)